MAAENSTIVSSLFLFFFYKYQQSSGGNTCMSMFAIPFIYSHNFQKLDELLQLCQKLKDQLVRSFVVHQTSRLVVSSILQTRHRLSLLLRLVLAFVFLLSISS